MKSRRNKLYIFLYIICFAGYLWLFTIIQNQFEVKHSVDVCLIKKITQVPCPSCGTTRSVIAIVQGRFLEAVLLNPLGYVVFLAMLMIPIWISYDVVFSKNTFFHSYIVIERKIRKPIIAIPLIIFIISNWIWNIYKGL